MKTVSSLTLNLLVFVYVASITPATVYGQETKAQLRIATVLGTEATIPYSRFDTDDPRLSEVMKGDLLLRIEDRVFLVVPRRIFRRAEMVDKKHVVTLSTGEQLTGTLACSVTAEAKTYSLSTAKKLEVVNLLPTSEKEEANETPKPTTTWNLRVHEKKDKPFDGCNLRFVVTWGRINIVGGYDNYEDVVSQFYIELDKNETVINPDDFSEIVFNERKVTLKSPSGVVTSAEVFYKVGRRESEKVYSGYLVMDLVDKGGMSIVLTSPQCVLTNQTAAKKAN